MLYFLSADFFFQNKLFFRKKSFFPEYHQSNNMDPDQTRRFVGPDLGRNSLQRLSAYDKTRR